MTTSAPIFRGESAICENCPFFHEVTESPDVGECHEDSVKLVMVPTPNPLTGQMELRAAGAFPPVPRAQWCGKHPGRAVLKWDQDEGFSRIPTLAEARAYTPPSDAEETSTV